MIFCRVLGIIAYNVLFLTEKKLKKPHCGNFLCYNESAPDFSPLLCGSYENLISLDGGFYEK